MKKGKVIGLDLQPNQRIIFNTNGVEFSTCKNIKAELIPYIIDRYNFMNYSTDSDRKLELYNLYKETDNGLYIHFFRSAKNPKLVFIEARSEKWGFHELRSIDSIFQGINNTLKLMITRAKIDQLKVLRDNLESSIRFDV